MIETVRVPISRFKYNMKPFIESATKGETIIVTSNGKDRFRVVPCEIKKPFRCPLGSVKWHSADPDEPAFPPLTDENLA